MKCQVNRTEQMKLSQTHHVMSWLADAISPLPRSPTVMLRRMRSLFLLSFNTMEHFHLAEVLKGMS